MSTLHFTLPQTTASPYRARHEAESFIYDGLTFEESANAVLILSELVTNAVIHGAEPIEVTLRRAAGNLRIEVSDGDRNSPRPQPQSDDIHGQGGRGLRIIDALASSWGTTLHGVGKTVWAEVDSTAAPGSAQYIIGRRGT